MRNDVSIHHPAWDSYIYTWSMMRDTLEGEDRVKFKSEQYLPIPGAMLEDVNRMAPSTQRIVDHILARGDNFFPLSNTYNPNYHVIPAYAAYKSRAQFPNLVSYLYRGLMGLALADSPSISLPPEMMYLEDDTASKEGLTLSRLFVKVLGETLLMGRCALVIDPYEDQLLITDYSAENFINWKTQYNKPILTVFKQTADEIPTDEEIQEGELFAHDSETQYAVQRLQDGVYVAELYDSNGELEYSSVPSYRGRVLTELPIVVLGALNNTIQPDPPPLAPVASTAVQIYMKNADLSQAEFLTCNPTLVITGVNDDLQQISTGPTVSFIISNQNAKVYYTETDTSALEFVHKHIDSLYEKAVVYGAQLLDSSKKSAETAETARLRQTAASATLRSVVTTVGNGFEQILKMIGEWMGLSQAKLDQIRFSPLTEFGSALTPQEQEQLVKSWMAGAISHQTVLSNFRKAGILGEGKTEEDEISQLKTEASDPILSPMLTNVNSRVQPPGNSRSIEPGSSNPNESNSTSTSNNNNDDDEDDSSGVV